MCTMMTRYHRYQASEHTLKRDERDVVVAQEKKFPSNPVYIYTVAIAHVFSVAVGLSQER